VPRGASPRPSSITRRLGNIDSGIGLAFDERRNAAHHVVGVERGGTGAVGGDSGQCRSDCVGIDRIDDCAARVAVVQETLNTASPLARARLTKVQGSEQMSRYRT
jgi:hypothetical protein